MLGYNLDLALRSFGAVPGLTALMMLVDRLWRGGIHDDVFGIPRRVRRSDSVEVVTAVRAANRCVGAGPPRKWRAAYRR